MTMEIRELRAKWQSYRQRLLRADYNQADEQLKLVIYFADHNPVIGNILNQLRTNPVYNSFNADEWIAGRKDADVMGAGDTNLGFSLDEEERTVQILKVLERAGRNGNLWGLGTKTYGGRDSALINYVRSAIEVFFEPFYNFIDNELRSMESLISPSDIMKQMQSLVDNTTSTQYPQTHKLLTDAYRQLFTLTATDSDSSWYQIGYSCRHVLIKFANETFDPNYVSVGQDQPKGDDAKEKLKWIVRYFLKQGEAGDRYREAIEDIVQANWKFVNNFGHRQESATQEDAKLAVIYTYLTISIVDNIISIQKTKKTSEG